MARDRPPSPPARPSRPSVVGAIALAGLAISLAVGSGGWWGVGRPSGATATLTEPTPTAEGALAAEATGPAAPAVASPSSPAGAPPPAVPSSLRSVVASARLESAAPRPSSSDDPSLQPSAAPAGSPSSGPLLDPPPRPGPFAMNLYEQGDFVSQADRRYCVPASIQTMLNIVGPHEDRSPKLQARLYALARKLSPPTLRGDGAEPEGWARTLDRLGVGPYVVDVQPSRAAALETAARAIRLTRRPVGLLVWRGAHAWVMSGFVASADPAVTDEFSVTHVFLRTSGTHESARSGVPRARRTAGSGSSCSGRTSCRGGARTAVIRTRTDGTS